MGSKVGNEIAGSSCPEIILLIEIIVTNLIIDDNWQSLVSL